MGKTAMNVSIVGRLTADPQIKQMNGNKGPYNLGNFSVAVERPFGAKKDENGNPMTDFWNCDSIGPTASYLQYCKKGNLVYLSGYFYMDSYVDKNGQPQRVPRFHADNIMNLESRQDGQQNNGGYQNGNNGGYQNGGNNQNNGGYRNQGGNGYQNGNNQNSGQNNGGYQNGNNGGYQNGGNNGQNNGGYQSGNNGQNNGGYQNGNNQNNGQNNGSYQNSSNGGGNPNGSGYNQNGGGYQNNGGGYNNNGGNNQNNGGNQPMNPPEGFAPADDDPFGLFSGAPDNY